jgi:hypothetical protein
MAGLKPVKHLRDLFAVDHAALDHGGRQHVNLRLVVSHDPIGQSGGAIQMQAPAPAEEGDPL